MSCPLWPISKRSRLEVRLEDRFEYELERTLHHPIPDRRYRKNADFAPVFRDLLPPGWKWLVHPPDQFVPQRLEQRPYALRLDGLEGNPVYSRRTIVLSRHLIRCTQGLHLADVDVETRETPGRFSLRLDVYPPPQVLQIDGRLCHLVLAFPLLETLQMAGPLRSTDITPLHRYYRPSRHPLVFGRLPGFAGYTAYLAPA